MRSQVVFFLLFNLILSVFSQNPGINIAVRPQTITDFKNAILPSILAKLQSITIPNFSTGSLDISNVQITSFTLPVDQIGVTFSNGAISVSASGLGVNVKLHVEAHLPLGIKIGADTTASASNSDLSFTADIGYASNQVQIGVNSVNVKINNLNIEISGILGKVASLILNLVTPLLTGSINNAIAGALQSNVQQALNNALANISDFVDLPGVPLGADYQIISVPIVDSDYISVPIDGAFYDDNLPFAVPPIPGPCSIPTVDESTSENVQFFISEYVFNSAVYGLFEAGYLALNVTPSMIPSGSPVSLNTQSLSILFPGIEDIYGSNQSAQLVCQNGENSPSISITTTGLEGALTGACSVQVYTVNNTWDQALILSSNLQFGGDISLNNYTLLANLTNAQISNVTVSDSKIPDIDVNQLTDVFNTILELSVPSMNEAWFSSGIPIPTVPNTDLDSAEITLYNCYFKVGATPVFHQDAGPF